MGILDKCIPMWAVLFMNLGVIGGMARNKKLSYLALALIAVILFWRIIT